MKVLHVTECYGAGVGKAIHTRVESTPELEHHLLWSGEERPSGSLGWKSVTELPSGFLKRVIAIQKLALKIQPDVIHAHSSWAGVYTRLVRLKQALVYEPHCYKFDDPSTNSVLRRIYWLVERALTRNTNMVGVLTPHEQALAADLSKAVKTARVVNTSALRASDPSPRSLKKLGMVGRLAPQKDPSFFLAVVEALKERGSTLQPVWIGDGSPHYTKQLIDAGVEVTGWLGKEELELLLSEVVYVHTASYEGFPLSVLDAANRGAPVLVRDIPAFDGYSFYKATDPAALAEHADRVSNPGPDQDEALKVSARVAQMHSTTELRDSLLSMYQEVQGK